MSCMMFIVSVFDEGFYENYSNGLDLKLSSVSEK
nr:hypothetical protein [uncultured bacterium]